MRLEKLQDEFYSPLRLAFSQGWKNQYKMKDFLMLCEEYVSERKLVAGWLETDGFYDVSPKDISKTSRAKNVSIIYNARIKQTF